MFRILLQYDVTFSRICWLDVNQYDRNVFFPFLYDLIFLKKGRTVIFTKAKYQGEKFIKGYHIYMLYQVYQKFIKDIYQRYIRAYICPFP